MSCQETSTRTQRQPAAAVVGTSLKTRCRAPRLLVAAALLALLSSFATGALWAEDSKAKKTEPAAGAVVDRPVRGVRVFLDREPVVEKSTLELVEAPEGLSVEGVHTMGENDLMGHVIGPMPDGKYTVKWSATFADGETASGEWSFEVKRGG